jgi:hypothetical protein
LVFCLQAAVAAPLSVKTVMSGLDNPRGLALSPWGVLFVAEAGSGGAGPCVTMRGQPRCYGPSGAVSRLRFGRQERVLEGLPSYADPAFAEVTGPHDIGFDWFGNAFVLIGYGDNPALRSQFGPPGAQFGTLVKIRPFYRWHSWQVVADLAAHEAAENPAGGELNSNPYGLLVLTPGQSFIADAGANALLEARWDGSVKTVATFRARGMGDSTDAVPTAVVRGPDRAYYVSELTGAPFADGSARIYRVQPGSAPTVFADGFKTIIDLDFARDGTLYVLQYATGPVFFGGPGEIIRVARDGTRAVIAGGLDHPTSLVAAPGGVIYVTNHGNLVGGGEVLRIVP